MFEFDIEEYMTSLEGLTYQEKVDELDSLIADLEEALDEAGSAQAELITEYDTSVKEALFATVNSLIREKNLGEKVSIVANDMFEVSTKALKSIKAGKVTLSVNWDKSNWVISIYLRDFLSPKSTMTKKVLSEIASLLDQHYNDCCSEIRVVVTEAELQQTLQDIITKLCGDE